MTPYPDENIPFQKVLESSPDIICILDVNGIFLKVNEAITHIMGYTQDEVLGKKYSDFIHPAHKAITEEERLKILEGSTVVDFENCYWHKYKTKVYISWSAYWSKATNTMFCIGRDITSRKEAEMMFRDMVEKSLVGVYIIQDGKFSYVNPKFAEIFDYQPEELINSYPVEIVVHEDERAAVLEKIRKRMQGEENSIHYESKGRKKDGQAIWMEVFGNRTQYKGNTAIIGTLLDITERVEAEKGRERARYMLNERIKELTTLYGVGQNLQRNELSIDTVLQEVACLLPFGWQYPEITAARITIGGLSFASPNFKAGIHQQLAEFISPEGDQCQVEIVYLEKKPQEQEDAFLLEERNMINMIAEMLKMYLTQKHEAEALRQSEANLQTIFDTTDIAYILIDNHLQILSFNQRASLFGREELSSLLKIGEHLGRFFPAERRLDLQKIIECTTHKDPTSYETQFAQPNGSSHWYHIKFSPVSKEINMELGYMLAITDITERKLQEEAAQQQIKLLQDLSFITSHELRHEYAKLHGVVNLLMEMESVDKDLKMILNESRTTFDKLNESIHKLNDKINVSHLKNKDQNTLNNPLPNS